jgi:ketosteroid isomerase-like protein
MISLFAAIALQSAVLGCTPGAHADLRAADQALMDAFAPGDRAPWDQVLAPDATYVDENGAILSGSDFLKTLVPLPPHVSGNIAITDYRLRVDGDTALVIHRDDEHENYHGIALHAVYLTSETWLCRNGQWKLALAHIYVEAKDPPAVTLPAAELDQYVGRYRAAPDLEIAIRREGDHLVLERKGRPPRTLLVETRDVLFVPGEPRIKRIFHRDAAGRVRAFIDRREGEDIVWKRVP